MKRHIWLMVLILVLVQACAHGPDSRPSDGTPPAPPAASQEITAASPEANAPGFLNQPGEEAPRESLQAREQPEAPAIADPLEPFNRAMYQFNDKLYFWVLKPVAQGYDKVLPEGARAGVSNFFSNLRFPVRFVSTLLEADFRGAVTEMARFGVNTTWGILGFRDPAAEKLNLKQKNADPGLALAHYGVGQGFYVVWPIVGPSSARDTLNVFGEYFLYPVSYIHPWYAWFGVRSYQEVNATSLRIGDYESLKEAAIDPYVSLRDAYVQYRYQQNEKQNKAQQSKPD